jgi:hypothetical protein
MYISFYTKNIVFSDKFCFSIGMENSFACYIFDIHTAHFNHPNHINVNLFNILCK